MWAAYIKTQPEQEIINNPCLGQEYNEETNIAETEFMIKFYHLFAKDMRYFLATEFAFPEEFLRILELYKEFLILNKGFVETKLNIDVKLPNKMSTREVETFYDKIKEVLKQEDLSLLLQYKDLV